MNYIIFDLEFNQYFSFSKDDRNIKDPKCPFEIIQIGAINLDENLNATSTFDVLVKPEIYKDLHPFVKEITGIQIEELETAKNFKEVYEEFAKFVASNRTVLVVWGITDLKELFRNIEFHGLDSSLMPKEYINIQQYVSKYLNCPKGTNIGLSNAVQLLDIKVENKFHNAFYDALYTGEVFKKVFNEDLKISIYEPNVNKQLTRQNSEKSKIDTYNLIKQFEKMYNREMSEEEKSIIKLAYIMGKTNQFEIKSPKREHP